MPRRSHPNLMNILSVTAVIFGLLGSCFGAMQWLANTSYRAAETVATRPYVDGRFDEQKKYIDERAAEILRQAMEHSDTNRREMTLQMERSNATLGATLAVLTSQMQSVLNELQRRQDPAPRHRNFLENQNAR